MNVVTAIRNYVCKMIEDSESGMKVLLMDKETTSIVSMVFTQSEIMQKEVYLLERIDLSVPNTSQQQSNDGSLSHLKCLVLLRPTVENISLLARELRKPKYGAYYLYFSNVLAKSDVKTLAENDEHEVVKCIQEFYVDYLAVNSHLFSVNLSRCIEDLNWNHMALNRTMQAIASVLLSLKKCPIIRYQNNSNLCKSLGFSLRDFIIKESSLFEFRESNNTLLLLLDRRDDPVTPLLNQWTYQAMVHELLTMNNNRVSYTTASHVTNELVLSAEQDDFYKENMFLHFGEIGQNIKTLVDNYQLKAKSHQQIDSIADMKRFIENYPQFKKMSGNVSKHVNLVGQLSEIVTKKQLLEVSEIEQDIVAQSDHSAHLQSVRNAISNRAYTDYDVIRLILLYALKYETYSNNDLISLINTLLVKRSLARNSDLVRSIVEIIEYGGQHARQSDVFDTNLLDASKITTRLFKGLKGVENLYTQHEPLLNDILTSLMKGKLNESDYPTIEMFSNLTRLSQMGAKCRDIIVFYVGGCTYEESLCVHLLNRKKTGFHVLLGGTSILNSRAFLHDVHYAVGGLDRAHTRNIRSIPLIR